jgi:hypothetical protein
MIRECLQDERIAVFAGERIKKYNSTIHFGVDFNASDSHKLKTFIIDTY